MNKAKPVRKTRITDAASWLDDNCQSGWQVTFFEDSADLKGLPRSGTAFQALRIEPNTPPGEDRAFGCGHTNKEARENLARKLGWKG